jgi:hypothetical protein
MTMSGQTTLTEMMAQSRDVITNPSVGTFERYEKRGSIATAGVYVLVAAILAGLLNFVTALITPGGGSPLGLFVGGVAGALLNFLLFTGLVYYLGKSMANGTGSWDEVAYSFALFSAPLAVVSGLLTLVMALLGWIPVLGALVGVAGAAGLIVVLLAQIYFGYLGVQSSMNIFDQGKAILVLVLAAVGTIVGQIVLSMLGSVLFGLLPVIILIALVAVIASMIMSRRGARR